MNTPQEPAYSVIVVEDDTTWQVSLTSMLRRTGLEAISVFDYSDAINQLKQLKPRPILAIVDLRLPTSYNSQQMDGLRLLDLLHEAGIYAIVLSAYTGKHADLLAAHPVVRAVIDKVRFTDTGFEDFFIERITQAVAYAEKDRYAEGQMPEQCRRLHN